MDFIGRVAAAKGPTRHNFYNIDSITEMFIISPITR